MAESMTIKQLAEVAGISRDTIERTVRRLYPELMQNGVETQLGVEPATAIMAAVRKVNMVKGPPQTSASCGGCPVRIWASINGHGRQP